MARWFTIFALSVIVAFHHQGAARADGCADVALVLALDASSSVSVDEFDFQKRAVADVFLTSDWAAAVSPAGGLAVAVMVWGDHRARRQVLDWRLIRTAKQAVRFAHDVERLPRIVHGNTDMGTAIWAALDLFHQKPVCAHRFVLNISGDGRESRYPRKRRVGPSLHDARLRATAMGVTINGLVLAAEDASLADYYKAHVIAGPGSFVQEVAGSSNAEMAAAMKIKLLRELGGGSMLALIK
jgi:hypothetical protein